MEKYLQYNHIELATDPDFIAWVKGNTNTQELDWNQWLLDHPEKNADVNDARSLVLGVQFKEESISTQTEDQVWAKISEKITQGSQSDKKATSSNRPRIIRMGMLGAAAAVALLLMIFTWGGSGDGISIHTQYAMMEKVVLPDGSLVTLNADSELQYDDKTWAEERTLNLKGEAFFSVKKGSKFTVETANGDVQVLGTSFNVYARDYTLNVHCETGMVSVNAGNRETILTPKQSVFTDGDTYEFKEKVTDGRQRSTWTKGVYTYTNTPLRTVIAELERQLGVTVKLEADVQGINYTGSFNKNNIETALSEVFWPVGLEHKIDNKTVVVSKK